jgi:D-psicose/D-tagatose/L-ribulose 3-epimerase
MRIGFNLLLWTTHVTEAHLPVIARIKAAGYDGVEVPVFEGEERHYAWLRSRLAEEGLSATVVGIIPDEARNPISADAASRQGGADHLAWLVDCSAALGAELICGPFHSPLGQFSGRGPTAEERARCAEAHQVMADRAAAAGLRLAVEPLNRFECYFLNTAEQAADLVNSVSRPNYRYLYDSFHANIEEKDPIGAVRSSSNQIGHVHISENDRGAPGEGHIDFAGALSALKAAGYDGWLTVEAFGQALPDLAAATRVWRPFFPSEDHVVGAGIGLIRRCWGSA